MKIDVEQFLREPEPLVNMDSGLGNPSGITAVGKVLADRLVARGWIAEQVDVGPETGKCTVVKSREAERYTEHLEALCEANGLSFKLKSRGGLSDANHIAARGAICLDGLAPTGGLDHSDKEYLCISTIEPNLRLAYLILCDLAEQKAKAE